MQRHKAAEAHANKVVENTHELIYAADEEAEHRDDAAEARAGARHTRQMGARAPPSCVAAALAAHRRRMRAAPPAGSAAASTAAPPPPPPPPTSMWPRRHPTWVAERRAQLLAPAAQRSAPAASRPRSQAPSRRPASCSPRLLPRTSAARAPILLLSTASCLSPCPGRCRAGAVKTGRHRRRHAAAAAPERSSPARRLPSSPSASLAAKLWSSAPATHASCAHAARARRCVRPLRRVRLP